MNKNVSTYIRLLNRWAEGRDKQDMANTPRWRLYWKYEVQKRCDACNAVWERMTKAEQEEFRQMVKKAVNHFTPVVRDTLAGAMQPMFKRKEQ